MSRWLAAFGLVMALSGRAFAQGDSGLPRIRLSLEDGVQVGRAAPQIELPYATSEGAGPTNQPFNLAKELGRVVVLVFYQADFSPGCTTEWRAFRDRAGTLFGSDVVVVGISGDALSSHVRFANELSLPFKLLTDSALVVSRRYGATEGARPKRIVVVVGRDGRARYVDPGFAPLDPASYNQLGAALKAVKETP